MFFSDSAEKSPASNSIAPALREEREERGTLRCASASEIKGWATRPLSIPGHILMRMDQSGAMEKATQFARSAYAARGNEIVREHQKKLQEMRSQLQRRGALLSGALFTETARIDAEQIEQRTVARLDSTLEGYDLHGITVDDQMAVNLSDDIVQGMKQMVFRSKAPNFPGAKMPTGLEAQYPRLVEQNISLSAAWVKTHIDRRRLMAKKTEAANTSITVYHVNGSNNRWLTNSQDNSVNVVTQSSEQIFTTLRNQVETSLPEGDEKKDILEKIMAMEKSENSASFKERYTEFIAAAANHMALIAPFIPALTEMFHKAL